jgi:hypothetical protein
MRSCVLAMLGMALSSGASFAQSTFTVTGTPIPPALLAQNYGPVPKGISAYDLNICNTSGVKQSVISSEIFQALSAADTTIQPIGRQIMLAAILRNQNHSASNIAKVALTSATAVFSLLSSSKYHVPAGLTTGAALGSIAGQQVLTDLSPVLSADQLETFEAQVLEPALVLDAGSCVERTVFATSANPKTKSQVLTFHVR